jgi:hypothetical protein
MTMILALDTMASRYGHLPSEIMIRANTFDLVIMDAAMSYQSHLEKQQDPNYAAEIPLDDLIKIRDSVL